MGGGGGGRGAGGLQGGIQVGCVRGVLLPHIDSISGSAFVYNKAKLRPVHEEFS